MVSVVVDITDCHLQEVLLLDRLGSRVNGEMKSVFQVRAGSFFPQEEKACWEEQVSPNNKKIMAVIR